MTKVCGFGINSETRTAENLPDYLTSEALMGLLKEAGEHAPNVYEMRAFSAKFLGAQYRQKVGEGKVPQDAKKVAQILTEKGTAIGGMEMLGDEVTGYACDAACAGCPFYADELVMKMLRPAAVQPVPAKGPQPAAAPAGDDSLDELTKSLGIPEKK